MKTDTYFHFKQFSLRHDRCAMKVGTDAVLLGSWANLLFAKNILDVGTGSGVIALMVAQRTSPDTRIDAIEIEKQDADQACENILQSPWPAKISVRHLPVQEFFPNVLYDGIISNPPFFNNSLKPSNKMRNQTRHTISLDHETLIFSVRRLLRPHGKFNVILPFAEGLQFITLALKNTLFCTRQYSFKTRQGKPIERWLLEFSTGEQPVDKGEITLYEKGLEWSDNYKSLTRDFYLKL